MKTIDDLLDTAKKATHAANDSELAAKLGVRPSAVSNYRRGVSLPNAVICATLAGLTGEPLVRVIGVVGEARAISSEEKKVWRRLAATAMTVCLCAMGFAGTALSAGLFAARSLGMPIMSNIKWWFRLIRLWLPAGRTKGPYIEARTCEA